MSLHTPGPWWMTETGVRNSGGYIVHTTSVSRYSDQNERYEFEVKQRESNKQLIAAAPEMLEAAYAALTDADAWREQGNQDKSWAPALRLAIAKAVQA